MDHRIPDKTPIIDEIETEDLTGLYNQFQNEDEPGDEFDKIVDHSFEDGVLTFMARYQGMTEGEHIVAVPFNILKRDVPLECAKYIRNYVANPSSTLTQP
jgi:hypothetical protein